jgi:hypothetical protein
VTAPVDLTTGPESGFEDGIDAVIAELVEVLTSARPVPLSSSVMVNREELLALVDEISARLPEELRAARRLLRERADYLAGVQREGEDILEAARERAERMVSRTEVVRQAQATARRALDVAATEARRLRHEAEDWCDAQLASLEYSLDGAMRSVKAGRARLSGPPVTPAVEADFDEHALFDQDSEER